MPATLDVRGVPDGATIQVSLYRCPSFDGVSVAGNPRTACYASNVPVTVYRLPPAANWDINGTSSVNTQTATLGQTVEFRHNLNSVGSRGVQPGDNVSWRTKGYLIRDGVKMSDFDVASGGLGQLNAGTSAEVSRQSLELNSAQDLKPGDQVCRYITFPDRELQRDPWESSAPACVTIVSNYDLFPKVQIGSDVILLGTTSDVIENVINNNSFSPDRQSPYAVYEYLIPAGGRRPTPTETTNLFNKVSNVGSQNIRYAEGSMATSGCDWLRGQAGFSGIQPNCKLLSNGNRLFDGQPDNIIVDGPIIADDYNPGDMICRIISVGYYSYTTSDPGARRISEPVCVTVAKAPHVQVWGNDVRVGDSVWPSGTINGVNNRSSVYTKAVTSGDRVFGSWVEYGVFAPTSGVIRSASGGVLSGAGGWNGGPVAPDYSALSFANTASPIGRWGDARLIKSFTETFSNVPLNYEGPRANLPLNSNEAQVPDGDLRRTRLTGGIGNETAVHGRFGTGGKNGSLIIQADGTVRITADIIRERQEYTAFGNASQLVIMARNIIIDAGVTRVDAWLIAQPASAVDTTGGIISTCNVIATPYYDGLALSSPCNAQRLTINGAVMAKELQLRRTAGATKAALGEPAEVINMRPDAYMWGNRLGGTAPGTGVPISTGFTKELPPRF